MKWLGPLLLLGVFVRHNTPSWLPGYTPPEWFYLLGGIWEASLCAALMLFLRTPLAIVALWIGISEGTQVAVCGAAMGHARAPIGVNECDYLLGFPLGPWLTGFYIILIAVVTARQWKRL